MKNKLDYDHMDDLKMLIDVIDETMEWLDTNQDASKGEYRKKSTEMDSLSRLVLQHWYKALASDGGNNDDVRFDK